MDKPKSSKLFDAVALAAKAHYGQFRKGTGIPYIVHPLRVVETLVRCGCEEDVCVAGALHDVVEDTDVGPDEIAEQFGANVARLIKGNTEPPKSNSWEARKEHSVEYFKSAPMDELMICVADKLDNIISTREEMERAGEAVWERFRRGREQQKWYFTTLAQVFESRAAGSLVETPARRFAAEVKNVFG